MSTLLVVIMTAAVTTGSGAGQYTWPVPGPEPQAQQAQRGQRGRGQGALPNPGPGVPVHELQQMFDAFALVQAQQVLQLSDEQYQRFFVRMNRLQELRRQHTRQRMRLINELKRMAGPQGTAGDDALTAQIAALDALDAKFSAELRGARAAIDEALTVRQRAAFRFFQEDMERRKIDFLTRARQTGR